MCRSQGLRPRQIPAGMNIFRLAGDMTHLLSFVVLLLKIQATRSCAGTDAVS